MIKSDHLSTENSKVSYLQRVKRNKHKGAVLWFTGLSGSGKSTVARELEKKLFYHGVQIYVLDGDNIRKGLSNDLGFSKEDRSENIRRIAEVAKLFANAGFIVITAFISPYAKDRYIAQDILKDFIHKIYIESSIATCKKRDPKGLYKKALSGKIRNFTGIDDVYEIPENNDLVIDTENNNIEQSVSAAFEYVKDNILKEPYFYNK